MTGWNCQAGGRPLQGPSPILCEQPDGTALPQPDRPVTNVMPRNIQVFGLSKRVMPARGSHRPVACSLAQLIGRRVSILLLDPLTFFVLLVLLLDGAPGHPLAAILLIVLFLCGVVSCPVDLLGVLGQVVPHTVRQIGKLLVQHASSFSLYG